MRLSRRFVLAGGFAGAACVLPFIAQGASLNFTSPAEKLMLSTIRIVGIDKRGKAKKFGSGFFYRLRADDGAAHDIIVTNKHVVDDMVGVDLAFHPKSADGDRARVLHVPGRVGEGWIGHPNDDVDLCALPLSTALGDIKDSVTYEAIEETMLPTPAQLAAFDAIEEVLMIGYPNGLWDRRNNLPLLRRGATASHPATPYFVDEMKDVPLTVIDIAAFPGSSGSPVFIFNPNGYTDKTGVRFEQARIVLIGVLAAGPTMESDGEILVDDAPTQTNVAPRINAPINLGYIVNASQLAELKAETLRTLTPPAAPSLSSSSLAPPPALTTNP